MTGVQKTQQLLIIDELSSLLHSEEDSDHISPEKLQAFVQQNKNLLSEQVYDACMKYQGDQDLEDIDSKLEDQMSSIFQEKYSEAKVLGAVLFVYQSQDPVFIMNELRKPVDLQSIG